MMGRRFGVWISCFMFSVAPLAAWSAGGHSRVAEAATLALSGEVPEFFRWGAATVAHLAIDPDVMKSRDTPQLGHQEYPEHFLDLELLEGSELPRLRYDYVKQVIELGLEPNQVGFVPWAVSEGTERLSLAFAEYRCWPDNPHVRSKALIYAGLLAHYAEDMIQPLHTSVHYDGRADESGVSPRTGIHRQVDSLFEQPGFEPGQPAWQVGAFEEVWTAVVTEFAASHALVETVYDLEPALTALYEEGTWDPALAAFAAERYGRAVEYLADLYLTAWRRSEDIELSQWLRRRGPDGELALCGAE